MLRLFGSIDVCLNRSTAGKGNLSQFHSHETRRISYKWCTQICCSSAYQNRLIVGNLVSLQLQSYQIGLNARREVFWVVLRRKGSAHHPPFSVGSTGTPHTEKVVLYTPQCFQPPPPKTEECSPSETRKWYRIRNDSLDKIKDLKIRYSVFHTFLGHMGIISIF